MADTPLRALLIGAGRFGRRWAANLQQSEDVILAGWVDLRSGAAAQAVKDLDYENVWCGDTLATGIEEARPDFVVDIASPDAHYHLTIESLRAGLPVLGEKPMAESMAQAREMVAASEKAGKLFTVSQNRRYDANLMAMRKLITDEIGTLGVLHSDFARPVRPGGFREEMASPLLIDMAIHTFDVARYLSGADPLSVYCEEFNPPWSWFRGDACATAIFEMTGGVHFTYRGSWVAEGFMTPWENRWRADGAHGSILWDGEHPPEAEVVDTQDGKPVTERRPGTPPEGVTWNIAGSLKDFVHALRTGSTPMGECHDNIKSLAMVFAAVESAMRGERVAVEM